MNRHQNIIEIGIICFLFINSLSACAAIFAQDMTLNIKETDVNKVIQNPTNSSASPFRISRIDMKSGFIRVFMEYRKKDGSIISGSYDIAFEISEGQPSATISNVNMPGLELDRTILDKISKLIVDDFMLASSKINGQVRLKSIATNEDSAQLVVNIK